MKSIPSWITLIIIVILPILISKLISGLATNDKIYQLIIWNIYLIALTLPVTLLFPLISAVGAVATLANHFGLTLPHTISLEIILRFLCLDENIENYKISVFIVLMYFIYEGFYGALCHWVFDDDLL